MVETVEDVTAASVSQPVKRIYVGGLGANVTADDIERIFTSLGRVRSVEFVRTNGRSFAYMDFEPQSDKALAKLFSTYNGCKWKGGKLRLEKAKEHYLSRLRREWEADAVPSVPVNQDVELNKEETKTRNMNLDSMKISIFFPKLKKIKLLPYKGSGKHKYSFQRVEVHSTLPLHFCDCEEHCGPQESANQTYLSALESAAHEKELSIMHSVLKKLLKENKEQQEELDAKTNVVELVESSMEEERKGEQIEEATEEVSEEESDEDLVINISSNKSDESLLNLKASHLVPSKQESKERKHQQSTESVPKRNIKKCTPKTLKPTQDDKESSPITTDKTILDEFSSLLSRNNTSSSENLNRPSDQKSTEKSGKSNDSWFQKSAWRDLVGDSTKNHFSLSSSTQPNITSILSKPKPVSENKVVDSTTASRKRKRVSNKGLISIPTEAEMGDEENDKKKSKQEKTIKLTEDNKEPSAIITEKTTLDEFSSLLSRNNASSSVNQNQPTDQRSTEDSGKKGDTWFQRSSWRDLVGDSTKTFFSLSSSTQPIVSSIISSTQPVSENKVADSTTTLRNRNQVSNNEGPISTPTEAKIGDEEKNKQPKQELRRVVKKVTVGEVCPFMRTAESEKEWNKAKKALAGYMKKKSNERADGSGVRKGAPFRSKRIA